MLNTPLASYHRTLGARMVPFAGYEMPVHYPTGVLAEHLACRSTAVWFDVSHMGQAMLEGQGTPEYLETLLPADLLGLKPGRQRYSFLTNRHAGIEDDLMVSNLGNNRFFLVVNAGRKTEDFATIAATLPPTLHFTPLTDRALIAVQGPHAAALLPSLAAMQFLSIAEHRIAGIPCLVSRSGYTGEDGFEISCPADNADALARHLTHLGIKPAGLGARDSLRLEGGLCLHGNDIDATTTPIEASLAWAIGKRRRAEGGYPGAALVAESLRTGPACLRAGIRPEGRAPARAGTPILAIDGTQIGRVTSGGFSPTLSAPIAMGYVPPSHAAPGTPLLLAVRDRHLPAQIVPLPFVPHRYAR